MFSQCLTSGIGELFKHVLCLALHPKPKAGPCFWTLLNSSRNLIILQPTYLVRMGSSSTYIRSQDVKKLPGVYQWILREYLLWYCANSCNQASIVWYWSVNKWLWLAREGSRNKQFETIASLVTKRSLQTIDNTGMITVVHRKFVAV